MGRYYFRMFEDVSLEEMTFKQRSEKREGIRFSKIWKKRISGKGNSNCKGSETECGKQI